MEQKMNVDSGDDYLARIRTSLGRGEVSEIAAKLKCHHGTVGRVLNNRAKLPLSTLNKKIIEEAENRFLKNQSMLNKMKNGKAA